MLVLARRAGEKIQIGNDITVTIVRLGPTSVRIGIKAPNTEAIWRTEIEPVLPVSVGVVDIGSRNVSASLNEAYPCHLHGCQDCGACAGKGE